MRKIKSKKATMEMGLNTFVTIVLVAIVLVLAVFFIQKIFRAATDSVDTLDEKLKKELNQLFSDEDRSVVVFLGSDKKARIRVNTPEFGVAIGAKTYDGSAVGDRNRMKYKITLDDSSTKNCVRQMGVKGVEDLLIQPVGDWISFDEWDGENAYTIVQFTIPKGTPTCTQKIFIDVRDNEQQGTGTIGGTSFSIEIISRFF